MREELLNMSEEELDSLEETVKDAASTVPEIIEGLARKKNGEPQQTIGNCIYVLQRDPLLAKRIRRNELAGYNIIDGDVGWKRRGSLLTNTDMNNLHFYLERNYGLGKVQAIDAAVDIIANENSFNPVIDRLENLHWDGKERIRFALHHFFGADLDAYVGEVMKMHLLAAIHRNYHPGEKYDICLCLVGEQGCGKSTFFRFLALDDNWFSDNVRSPHEKDIYTKLQGHLVIELSEMKAGTRDTDTEEMKAFITRQKDTYRTPYDKYPETTGACVSSAPPLMTCISSPLTGAATVGLLRSASIRSRGRSISWKTKRSRGLISNRCGRKPWNSTGRVASP